MTLWENVVKLNTNNLCNAIVSYMSRNYSCSVISFYCFKMSVFWKRLWDTVTNIRYTKIVDFFSNTWHKRKFSACHILSKESFLSCKPQIVSHTRTWKTYVFGVCHSLKFLIWIINVKLWPWCSWEMAKKLVTCD